MNANFYNKFKPLAFCLKHPKLALDSKNLFILSHMRSRSSVLSHILGSNDNITGYSELHRSYISKFDLLRMRAELCSELKHDANNRYFLDKVLGNHLQISDPILKSNNTKCLFLLREPERTIKSIMGMGFKTDIDWYKNPEKATEYYCSRLDKICEYAEKLEFNFFYIESDTLINNTKETLEKLSVWLGLENQLENDYSLFANTGKEKFGDPSESILTGKIINTNENKTITLSRTLLDDAEKSYEKCHSILSKNINAS